MIHNKIHLIIIGCPRPSTTLHVQNRGLKRHSFLLPDIVSCCDIGNGGCDQICAPGLTILDRVCDCESGYALAKDGEDCIGELKHYSINNE